MFFDKILEIIKLICLICVETFFLFLGSLFKRKKEKIVFGAWFGQKYDDNPKYLYEYTIHERKDLDVMWITASKQVYNELKEKGYPVLLSSSIKAMIFCLKTKYVITCTSANDCGLRYKFPILNNAVFVNLWHGVPLKKIMYDDKFNYPKEKPAKTMIDRLRVIIKKIDRRVVSGRYHVATSEAIANIYVSAFRTEKRKILTLGQARNDYFFSSHVNVLKKQFEGKTLIVYMPTHRNEGKVKMDTHNLLDLSGINTICRENNALLIIKKHFYHREDPIIRKGEFSNIIELTNDIKSQELIDAADILITDYSSVYIDYLLLDKPIIFYAYDLQWYLEKDRDMYLDYNQKNMPGRICSTEDELSEEIVNLLKNDDSYVNNRIKMKNYFYSKENQKLVCPKQIETILSL